MIQINKQEQPEILQEKKEQWTKELLELLREKKPIPEKLKNKYRHPDIKKALRESSFDKCVYCESKVTAISFGDVEHIKPKSKYPDLTFDWDNLAFVCAKCNNEKSDNYDEELPFINPYRENPEDSLIALGHFIYHKAGNKRGKITEKDLNLNRPELIERRKERIDNIRRLLDLYAIESNPTSKEGLLKEIEEEIADDKPYSMCAKSTVSNLMPGIGENKATNESA